MPIRLLTSTSELKDVSWITVEFPKSGKTTRREEELEDGSSALQRISRYLEAKMHRQQTSSPRTWILQNSKPSGDKQLLGPICDMGVCNF
ncbi:hypothetical protein N7461_006062 [Penicillium sp. DV-2018c]|nr:hypothetical protein N7461_006062 [Penicillium sp. DV-2018c]